MKQDLISDNLSAHPEPSDLLGQDLIFPTLVYSIEKLEFLNNAQRVFEENIQKTKQEQNLDEIFPAFMSPDFSGDIRIKELTDYIGLTAWNILSSQGFDMDDKFVKFSSMWGQEHYKHSMMEQHTHALGSQIVGFYFLATPDKCSNVVFHDPRPGKLMTNLLESNSSSVTYGSSSIFYTPKPGMLFFTNSWLPHSFSRHGNDAPLKFIHFNIEISTNVVNPSSFNSSNNPQKTVEII